MLLSMQTWMLLIDGIMQDEKGTRSRGRILKEGLPPVFDYEINQPEQDNSSKVGSDLNSSCKVCAFL